jgi:3-oxoacyl-(acyl-carrier-protein) synthase
VPNVARDHQVGVAVSNAFAFGGACSALVLRREGSPTCH